MAHRYGAEVAGLLAMTLRILGAPLGLLGKSVLDVFKRHAASHYRQYGECSDMYIRTLKVLSVGSLIFVVAMLFLSESLFVVFLERSGVSLEPSLLGCCPTLRWHL